MSDNPVEAVIETLKGMNALQLADLKNQIEEVFGVTAAAPSAPTTMKQPWAICARLSSHMASAKRDI